MAQEFQWTVVDDITPPVISGVDVIDGKTIDVLFSEAVVEAEALNPANYAFTNGLQVLALSKITAAQYRLTTTLQTPGLSYQLTVSNVHDLSGNLI